MCTKPHCFHSSGCLIRFDNQKMTAVLTPLSCRQMFFSEAVWRPWLQGKLDLLWGFRRLQQKGFVWCLSRKVPMPQCGVKDKKCWEFSTWQLWKIWLWCCFVNKDACFYFFFKRTGCLQKKKKSKSLNLEWRRIFLESWSVSSLWLHLSTSLLVHFVTSLQRYSGAVGKKKKKTSLCNHWSHLGRPVLLWRLSSLSWQIKWTSSCVLAQLQLRDHKTK